jgi:hypothetical protein
VIFFVSSVLGDKARYRLDWPKNLTTRIAILSRENLRKELFYLKVKKPILTMIITLVIFGMIMVVAYFARQKITSWRTYAAVGSLSRVDASHWFDAGREFGGD